MRLWLLATYLAVLNCDHWMGIKVDRECDESLCWVLVAKGERESGREGSRVFYRMD